ncbi:MAG: ABC transporter ATP-binding protein [Meiothermus silvanus]|nr:ABC transporter ATP-binding protein [Allomeiothermus silvanus]
MSFLQLHSISKTYPRSGVVLQNLDLEVQKGELIALLGPSGCGKTTTLRIVAGLLEPSGGQLKVDGRDITRTPPYHRNMGLVFQNYALFPHLTVERNVAFGLEIRGVSRQEIVRRVGEALELVRLSGFQKRSVRELSGGQQQRVALARALVIQPDVLLLDEPLSNLDAKLRDEMRNEIRRIQQELHITTIFVTHDQLEALTMSDRVAVMHKGRLVQLGTPWEVYERPAAPFVAEFVGRINVLEGHIRELNGFVVVDALDIQIPARDLPSGRKARAMIRPHRLRLQRVPVGNTCGAEVRVVSMAYSGDLVHYEVATRSGHLLNVEQMTKAGSPEFFMIGELAHLSWNPEDWLVFPIEDAA